MGLLRFQCSRNSLFALVLLGGVRCRYVELVYNKELQETCAKPREDGAIASVAPGQERYSFNRSRL